MRQMHMPAELKHTLREYFMHFQAAMVTFNERSLLEQLSPHLQAKVTNLANAGLIRQVPFFQGQEDRCITAVMLALKPNLFVPDEMICYMGELGTDVYILKSGEVQVFVHRPDGKGVKEIARLRKGNFFGEMAVVNGEGARRMANVKSVAYSIIYSMSNKDLLPVMDKFGSLKIAIEQVAAKREAETAAAQRRTSERLSGTKTGDTVSSHGAGSQLKPAGLAAPRATATNGGGSSTARATAHSAEILDRVVRMDERMSELEKNVSHMAAAMEEQQKGYVAMVEGIAAIKDMMASVTKATEA